MAFGTTIPSPTCVCDMRGGGWRTGLAGGFGHVLAFKGLMDYRGIAR